MLLDRGQKSWLIATALLFLVALAVYVPYAMSSIQGPTGGSALGLTYGIIGSAMMVFAGLLAARKKVPVWRVGSAQTWMKGHLWLGLLSFPLILFHSGFHFGGALTSVLMWLFIIVILSGVLGAALQHYLPRMMMAEVPLETIYEEIPHVRAQLLAEADQLVAAVCGPLGGDSALPATSAGTVGPPRAAAAVMAAPVEVEEESVARMREFFLREVRPFLENPKDRKHPLVKPAGAEGIFEQVRIVLPSSFAGALDDLESICEENRQLTKQERIHDILHGWLLVHIPLSFALLLLGAVHAVMALRY